MAETAHLVLVGEQSMPNLIPIFQEWSGNTKTLLGFDPTPQKVGFLYTKRTSPQFNYLRKALQECERTRDLTIDWCECVDAYEQIAVEKQCRKFFSEHAEAHVVFNFTGGTTLMSQAMAQVAGRQADVTALYVVSDTRTTMKHKILLYRRPSSSGEDQQALQVIVQEPFKFDVPLKTRLMAHAISAGAFKKAWPEEDRRAAVTFAESDESERRKLSESNPKLQNKYEVFEQAVYHKLLEAQTKGCFDRVEYSVRHTPINGNRMAAESDIVIIRGEGMAIVSCFAGGTNTNGLKDHVRELAAMIHPKRMGIRCAGLMVTDLLENQLKKDREEITETFYDIRLLIRRDLAQLVNKVQESLDEL